MRVCELGSGKYSDCFKVSLSGAEIAMKLSYYQEATIKAFARHAQHGNTLAAHVAKEQDAISVSMAMAEVAKNMKSMRISPHFVTVYCEADVRYLPKRLTPLLGRRLSRLTPQQLKYSHVCLMELYSCNVTSFLARFKARDRVMRALIFQVLYTLACLQELFPGFRHNDLSTNNVLIKAWGSVGAVRYTYGTTSFFVSGVPFKAALTDFDFTHVPGSDVMTNERVLSGNYSISAEHNPSYDAHLFLKTLKRCLSNQKGACPETQLFLDALKLDPSRDRLRHTIPHLVPARLLAHSYFQCLKVRMPYTRDYALPTE